MSKFFYFGNEQVSVQLSNLQEKIIDGDLVYFNNLENTYWKIREINSMYVGAISSILVKQPEPGTDELINLLFASDDNYDVAAAALILKENEILFGVDYRENLFRELEKIKIYKLNREQKNRIQNIIILSELHHGENRRDVLNKKHEVIKTDSTYFMNIALNADILLEKLRPNLFEKFIAYLKRKNKNYY